MFGIDNNFEDNDITYNRKLKLEEFDDEGQLIDCVEFSQKDLLEFYILKNNGLHDIRTARKNIKDYFNTGNTKLKTVLLNNVFYNHKLDDNLINLIESILNTYSEDAINFVLTLKDYHYNESSLILSLKDINMLKESNFFDLLAWTKNTTGIYYALSNDARKGMYYFEKPTKKQAKYQRQKHGKRIIFLNFKDWKEYLVSESELD